MKKWVAGLGLLLLLGCAGEGNVRDEAPKKAGVFEKDVTDFTVTPEPSKMRLSWKLEDTTGVKSVDIMMKYKLVSQNNVYVKVKSLKPQETETVIDAEPLSEVVFKVYLTDKSGRKSKGVVKNGFIPHPNVIIDEVQNFDENKPRRLYIYLPDGYAQGNKIYPVVYFHDGQNLFSTKTGSPYEWMVDEVLTRLIKEGKVEEMIVVGIPHGGSKRAEQYIPCKVFYHSDFQGKGAEYSEYVVKTVIPYVESKYRVSKKREDRAVMGSSLGGSLSLWMLAHYPDVFSMAGVVSPYGAWITNEVSAMKRKDVKIWMDCGTHEVGSQEFQYLPFIRIYCDTLLKNGLTYGKNFVYYEADKGNHHEIDWSKRVEYPLILFKGKTASTKPVSWKIYPERTPYKYEKYDWIINPMADFDNGMCYSLYRQANYSIEGKSAATVNERGEVTLNGETNAVVVVKYQGEEQKVEVYTRKKKKK